MPKYGDKKEIELHQEFENTEKESLLMFVPCGSKE